MPIGLALNGVIDKHVDSSTFMFIYSQKKRMFFWDGVLWSMFSAGSSRGRRMLFASPGRKTGEFSDSGQFC